MRGDRDGTWRIRLFWRGMVVLYLGYFAIPVHDLITGAHGPAQLVLGGLGLVAFAALYLPAAFTGVFRSEDRPDPLGRIAACTALGALLALVLGLSWSGLMVYAAFLAGGSIRRGPAVGFGAVAVIAAVSGAVAALLGAGPGAVAASVGYTLVAGVFPVAIAWIAVTYRELDETRAELARVAVARERLRFARDLHDLLGHSLSVIALKSELAGRLLERDPARAAAEVRDVEAVTRQALAEVRHAVTGYREGADLGAELARARAALTAAGVRVEIDEPTGSLPADVEALLAWTIREGATNVVRHAGADRCAIRVRAGAEGAAVEIVDDGVGGARPNGFGRPGSGPNDDRPGGDGPGCADPTGGASDRPLGNGLGGLAERVVAADGLMEVGDRPEGGFRLAVRVPPTGAAEREPCGS